jgi:LAO/AO transport system kinase
MERLSVHPSAFIRPSPSSGNLGGVAEKTRECILVCEAAGYDVVIVETVGVGQSETAVAGMTDLFAVMQLPNAGDDLQAIKKGIMELADLVLINKTDLDPQAATRAQAHISSALRLFATQPRMPSDAAPWQPPVMLLSALKGSGIEDFWGHVLQYQQTQQANGLYIHRRQNQALTWMNERIQAGLQSAFKENPRVKNLWPDLTAQVLSGRLAPSTAARRLLQASRHHPNSSGETNAGHQ